MQTGNTDVETYFRIDDLSGEKFYLLFVRGMSSNNDINGGIGIYMLSTPVNPSGNNLSAVTKLGGNLDYIAFGRYANGIQINMNPGYKSFALYECPW